MSLRKGWPNHDTQSVTSLSPRSSSDALDALRVLAGLTLNDPLEVETACLNSWCCAAEIFLWSVSSSSSSEMDLSLILSSGSKAAEKFTGEASLVGESTDEDLVTGERDREDSLVSSNPLALLTGVLAHLTSILGCLSEVLDGVSDLLGGVSSLGTGTVDCAAGLAWASGTAIPWSIRRCSKVHMDIKSINVAWMIDVGIDGNRGLLTPVKMDASCPPDGVFPAGVPWAVGPSNTKGLMACWAVQSCRVVKRECWAVRCWLLACWVGNFLWSIQYNWLVMSCWPVTCRPVICWAVICWAVTCRVVPCRAVICWPIHNLWRTRHWCWAGDCRFFHMIWSGQRRDHCYGSPLWGLGNGRGQLYFPSGDVWWTRPSSTLSSSLMMMTRRRLAVGRRPWWQWRQGSVITQGLAMMMSMRGRGWMTGVRRLGNTAGPWTTSQIHMSRGAGHTQGTWTGPLTLSSSAVMSRNMVSGGILVSVGPVRSSLTIPTSWSVAFPPVGAGPSCHRDTGSHRLLGFTGPRRPYGRFLHFCSLLPRTSGCLGSFGLGRSIAAGTLGRKLKDLFWSMYFNWVVHGLTFLGFLRHFRRCRHLTSFLPFVGLGLRLPSLRQPILTDVAGRVVCTQGQAFLSRHCWQRKWLSLHLRKWVHPGNFSWDSTEDDRSRDLESAILSTQVRLDMETKINSTSDHKRLDQNVHTWDRLTSFTAATNYLLFVLVNRLGRPLGQCAIGLTSAHERGENRSERQVDMVLCAGAAAHGAERGLNFIVWNFAWDGLASRLYAATATTFLMKIKWTYNHPLN